MAVHGSDDQFGVGLLYVWLDIAEADFSDYYSVGVASGQIICRHRARLRVDDVIAIVLRSDIPRQFRMLCFAGSGLLLCAHAAPALASRIGSHCHSVISSVWAGMTVSGWAGTTRSGTSRVPTTTLRQTCSRLALSSRVITPNRFLATNQSSRNSFSNAPKARNCCLATASSLRSAKMLSDGKDGSGHSGCAS